MLIASHRLTIQILLFYPLLAVMKSFLCVQLSQITTGRNGLFAMLIWAIMGTIIFSTKVKMSRRTSQIGTRFSIRTVLPMTAFMAFGLGLQFQTRTTLPRTIYYPGTTWTLMSLKLLPFQKHQTLMTWLICWKTELNTSLIAVESCSPFMHLRDSIGGFCAKPKNSTRLTEREPFPKIALKCRYMNSPVAIFCVWITDSLSIEMHLPVFRATFINWKARLRLWRISFPLQFHGLHIKQEVWLVPSIEPSRISSMQFQLTI